MRTMKLDDLPHLKSRDPRALFGPLSAAILLAGIAGLAQGVPGYSSVRQTVSEIGEVGSPERLAFALMLLVFAACILVFAAGLRRACLGSRCSTLSAWLTGLMAVICVGIAFSPFPHPLHNVFGESELVAYQAPLAWAVTWRRESQERPLVVFSWVMAILMWVAIVLNMSVLDRTGALYTFEKPVYGLVQRLLFVVWTLWCAGAGLLLFWRRERSAAP